MSQRFCHHVNPAGVFCGGPPVNHRDYCFWHMHETGRRMKAARARARSERVIIHLPVLDDLHAVQVGLMQLADAIAHREIDPESGRLLLSVLRLAAANLKSDRGWSQRAQIDTFGMDANIVVEEPAFERQYGLPNGFDLSRNPEQAFPPPQPAVEAAPAQHADERRTRPAGASHRSKAKQSHRRTQLPETPGSDRHSVKAKPSRDADASRKPPHTAADARSSSAVRSAAGSL